MAEVTNKIACPDCLKCPKQAGNIRKANNAYRRMSRQSQSGEQCLQNTKQQIACPDCLKCPKQTTDYSQNTKQQIACPDCLKCPNQASGIFGTRDKPKLPVPNVPNVSSKGV